MNLINLFLTQYVENESENIEIVTEHCYNI